MVLEQVLSPGASITSIVACVEPGEVFVLLGFAYRYELTESQAVLCSGDSLL